MQRSLVLAVSIVAVACGAPAESGDASEPPAPDPAQPTHATSVHEPEVLRGLVTEAREGDGTRRVVPCMTCHEGRTDPHTLPTSAEEIGGPHVGLRFDHGELRCAACHHPERADSLRLADGRAIPLTAAMDLCSQCHGPQRRDYDHGSHGGMQGYWDRTRGPRTRNHCVDCHDVHEPAFGRFQPMPPPRDRRPTGGPSHD